MYRSPHPLGSLGNTSFNDGLFMAAPAHPGLFASSSDFHALPGAAEFSAHTRRGLRDDLPIVLIHNDLRFTCLAPRCRNTGMHHGNGRK